MILKSEVKLSCGDRDFPEKGSSKLLAIQGLFA
jgi:hypothetical protein